MLKRKRERNHLQSLQKYKFGRVQKQNGTLWRRQPDVKTGQIIARINLVKVNENAPGIRPEWMFLTILHLIPPAFGRWWP